MPLLPNCGGPSDALEGKGFGLMLPVFANGNAKPS